jgi:hypothetical protein
MKTERSSRLLVLTTGLVLGLLPGCASAPSDQEADPKAAQGPAPGGERSLAANLRKGMTQEQVREMLGNPAQIRPVRGAEGTSERWVYERRVSQVVDQQATGSQDVPYIDPFTGEMRMIQEPTYSQVTKTITEELHLLWRNGGLESWTTLHRSKQSLEK